MWWRLFQDILSTNHLLLVKCHKKISEATFKFEFTSLLSSFEVTGKGINPDDDGELETSVLCL